MPIFKAIYKKLSGKWHPQAVSVYCYTGSDDEVDYTYVYDVSGTPMEQ